MKRLIPSLFLLAAFSFAVGEFTGCKGTPQPPTEQDAIAVWKDTHANPHLSDLISLKKTNGQMQESNGVPIYTLYYQAEDKTVARLGNSPAGTINRHQGSYAFQWTEKGWMGPDNQIYPVH
jgi:hypothetical protein